MHRTEHLDYLDGWRGLAILFVLESHFLQLSIQHIDGGRLGVDLFFVLSGYLMAGLLFIKKEPLGVFYRRRISRIAPAFFVFVAIVFSVAVLRGQAFTWQELVSTLTFTRTYVQPPIWKSEVPVQHIWSLNIEEHAYILMSLIVLLGLRARAAALLLLAGVACLGIWIVMVRTGAPFWSKLGTEVAAAHIMLAAGYRVLLSRHPVRVPPWLPLVVLAVGLVAYHGAMPWWVQHLIPPVAMAFAVNHIQDVYPVVLRLLAHPALRFFGLASFSLYLWQQPFFKAAPALPGGIVTAGVLAVVVGVASYYLIEKPARAWLNARWRSTNAKRPSPAVGPERA